jgi:hypothetical protein
VKEENNENGAANENINGVNGMANEISIMVMACICNGESLTIESWLIRRENETQ